MKEIIYRYIKKNRYFIYSAFLSITFLCLTISEKFFYNYLIPIVSLLGIFLIFSAYIKIKIEYFFIISFLVFIGSLSFFLFGKQSIGIRFLFFSILLITFGFFTKYFYKFYERMEKNGRKKFINLGFLILSIIIIFSAVLSFSNYKKNINLSEKYYKEAVHFYGERDYYNAIDFLHKSINFNKFNYEAYNLLGRSYLKIENFEESKKYLICAIRLKSDYYNPLIALGTAYDKDNEFEKAINIYKKAKKMKSGDFGAHFGLGRVYYKIGDLEKSLDELLIAEEINSNNYELQYLLGSIYYKKNLLEEALKHFNLIKDEEVPKGFELEYEKSVKNFIKEISK